jgi:predicted membrane chloride channel (bestrophin family)
MTYVKHLRTHIFSGSLVLPTNLVLLEQCMLLDILARLTAAYEGALKLASTPLPFPLVQMARTFLFIWVFTMPLVLVGRFFSDVYSTIVFVFFLTYGFIGLEFVGMQMLQPYGVGLNDLELDNMVQVSLFLDLYRCYKYAAGRSMKLSALTRRIQTSPLSTDALLS